MLLLLQSNSWINVNNSAQLIKLQSRLPGELLQVPRKVAMFLHAHTNMSEETTEPEDQPGGGFALINKPY